MHSNQHQVAVTNHDNGNVSTVWVSQLSDPVSLKFEIQERLELSGEAFWDATDLHGGWVTGSEI
jgi:hypothetical protein